MKKTRRSYNSTLPRSKGPTRKTRLKVKGRSRFPKRRNDAYRKWIRTFPCVVRNEAFHCCTGLTECCHVKSRGAGGEDVGNCYPGCRNIHEMQHRVGFAEVSRRFGYDLRQYAAQLGRRWREQQGEPAA